jgi:hypothetical protein
MKWERKSERLQWLFTEADTQANIRGTAWAAFNAIGEYYDWYQAVRGSERTADADATRFARSLDGGVDAPKEKALRVIRKVLTPA